MAFVYCLRLMRWQSPQALAEPERASLPRTLPLLPTPQQRHRDLEDWALFQVFTVTTGKLRFPSSRPKNRSQHNGILLIPGPGPGPHMDGAQHV